MIGSLLRIWRLGKVGEEAPFTCKYDIIIPTNTGDSMASASPSALDTPAPQSLSKQEVLSSSPSSSQTGVCNISPGHPCPAKRPVAFKKSDAPSEMFLDTLKWSSDSEVESELDDEVLAALPLPELKEKPGFEACLLAAAVFVAGPSFNSSADSFSEKVTPRTVTLQWPSPTDSGQESNSDR
ncbi:hypothetical protein A6R68_22370 [Neotoma lepida]|uniref:Uncharacterized protein n=1 Tax=Neotoma lepida TaxID=56216 RepID=A0A1A6I056_NEOLE|nr:hypothetical protein A6R68_22370 [Neotoma lepida]